jgi:hypothetical protein
VKTELVTPDPPEININSRQAGGIGNSRPFGAEWPLFGRIR